MGCKAYAATNGGDHDTVREAASAGMVAGGRSRKRLLRSANGSLRSSGEPVGLPLAGSNVSQPHLRRAPCDHRNFVSNAAYGGLVQCFLKDYVGEDRKVLRSLNISRVVDKSAI